MTSYTEKFGAEPTYDTLLDQVTGFKVERAQLLADYIEPSDQEVADGAKVPRAAHHAIARLVRDGYIRVIITTNFDQLLEQALRAVNVTPRVIATPEAVEQALPLVHQQCTVIKVHGDYTSGELKNTTEELEVYDQHLNIRHLVLTEIEAVLPWLNAHVYSPQTPPPSGEFASEMSELLMELGPTIAMLVAGGRWGEREQHETWRGALERVLDASHGHIFELRWNGYWAGM